MKNLTRMILTLSAIFISSSAIAESFSVGTQSIQTTVKDTIVPIRLFYPTTSRATENSFGPWVLPITPNAPAINSLYPLIIISHGLDGREWSHHILAQELVKSGFMVAALHHPDDLLRVGSKEHLALRPLELSSAIDAVLKDLSVGQYADKNRIGAFGFSLGGYTVLATAGGEINFQRISDHCKENAVNDPEFCIGEDGGEPIPTWLKARRFLYSPPAIDTDKIIQDKRLKAIVLAAPAGVPFSDLSKINVPTMLIRAEHDMSLRNPYHAEYIHSILHSKHVYKIESGLHHYAFLSPFPESIATEVGEPANDPEGFNRLQFLGRINLSIVSFFRENL